MKKLPKVKTWRELRTICNDETHSDCIRWRKVVVGTLENLGNPTLDKGDEVLWKRAWSGLQEYISALVGEYGQSETKAERDILAEVNHCRDLCDDVQLEKK